jgi:2,3-bisphosphoglycerate-independent phosphoglycerate mutase
MKYALLIGDGMADRPLAELGDRTPLDFARTPWMDKIAREGLLGMVRTIPPGFPPGSDIANLVILGYDPAVHYTGRGPLEAASMGIGLGPDDVAFRCNLVHLTLDEPSPRMKDFTAGHIATAEARPIISALNESLGDRGLRLHAGVSYRHLLVWKNGADDLETTPPHDIPDREVGPYLPKGKRAEVLLELIQESQRLLRSPSFLAMISQDNPNPPNSIWPWGQGKAPSLEPITRRWGIRGAIITAVDLLRGLGIYAGLDVLRVPGVTGYYDTDYEAKGRYAVEALEEGFDFVLVHVEAPDEAGHQGDIAEKVKAIESFDRHVVGTILNRMNSWEDWSVMVLPDHATPICVRTHTEEPVPFAVLSSRNDRGTGGRFSEEEAGRRGLQLEDGRQLLGRFLLGSPRV